MLTSQTFLCQGCGEHFEELLDELEEEPEECPVCQTSGNFRILSERWSPDKLNAEIERAKAIAKKNHGGEVHDPQRHMDLMGKSTAEVLQTLYQVTDQEIAMALEIQKHGGGKLGQILVEMDVISEEQLMACLAVLTRKEQTLLSHAFFTPLQTSWWSRHTQLWFESFIYSLLATGLMMALDVPEGGLISLFLVTAGLSTRFEVVLADSNKRREAMDILAMFSGLLMAYGAIAFTAGPDRVDGMFTFVIHSAGIDSHSAMTASRFADLTGILHHNAMVMAAIAILVFIYRGYAFLLSLTWNACVWGLVLTTLIIQTRRTDGGSDLLFALQSMVAVLPHLTLEILGYIFCALTFFGISKAYLWYGMSRRLLVNLGEKRLVGLGLAIACLGLSAVLEAHWAPYMLER